jgi:antitoxin HigA-1
MDRPRGFTAASRRAFARLLHGRRQTHLRRPSRHWHVSGGTEGSSPASRSVGAAEIALKRAAPAIAALRVAARSVPRPLGRAKAGGRDHLFDLDGRQPVAADGLCRVAGGQASRAGEIHVPPNRVTQILHGRRSITGDTALRLGHWFGMSAQFWLNLQSAYDIRVAEEKAGQEIAQLPTRPAGPIADRPK